MQLISIEGNGPFLIKNASVLEGSSLIYSNDFKKIYHNFEFDPARELLGEEIGKTFKRLEVPIKNGVEFQFEIIKPIVLAGIVEGAVVPINLLYSSNYFHFLIEVMPSILDMQMRGFFVEKNITYVTGALHPNFRSILNGLLHKKNIFEIERFNYVQASQVFYPKPSYVAHELINKQMPNVSFAKDNISLLRRSLRDHWGDLYGAFSKLKIFVVRKSGQRNIINIDELVCESKRRGYTVIQPEFMNINEQIRLFSSAVHVIGPTGAWLANMVFMNSECCVEVMYPNTALSPKSIWIELGKVLNIEVKDHYFDVSSLNEYQPIHSDFKVELCYFERMLK